MNDTTLSAADRIRAFADAVRAELADLPGEEIDDLVEGLVGDLTDQAADHGGVIDLGDPAAYAQELRDAAGLPERDPAGTKKTPWSERIAASAGRTVDRIRASAAGAWLLDLLIAIRPVWWVLRGLALWWILATATPLGGWLGPRGPISGSVPSWGLLLACTLLSIQWGRGRWLPKNWLRHVRTVASVLAVLIIPVAMGTTITSVNNALSFAAYPESYSPPPGLSLDGDRVGNLFVYDKDGNLIDGAQIYTNRGTPLDLVGRDGEGVDNAAALFGPNENGMTTLPFRDAQGRTIWNIYPLQLGRVDMSTMQLLPTDPLTAQPPFLRAPQRDIVAPTSTPAPESTSGATLSPTPGPTPTPVPTPTPTPEG